MFVAWWPTTTAALLSPEARVQCVWAGATGSGCARKTALEMVTWAQGRLPQRVALTFPCIVMPSAMCARASAPAFRKRCRGIRSSVSKLATERQKRTRRLGFRA